MNSVDDIKATINSTIERNVPEVPVPAKHKLGESDIFPNDAQAPDAELVRKHFMKEGNITINAAAKILMQSTQLFKKEPNLLNLPAPTFVCGDIHGQFYDLIHLFDVTGNPLEKRFLFLGDYVDRGCFGMEVLLYLLAIKCVCPKSLFMLRGNHESRFMTNHFTFKKECILKYSADIYELCVELFNALPLCAVVNKQYFCVHGGLSPHINILSEIKLLNRFQEPPSSGAMCDFLWSDPAPRYRNRNNVKFMDNTVRGCSYYFTHLCTSQFIHSNKLLCVIRGHEAQQAGYRMYDKDEINKFPNLITVFSAPNYCDTYGNKAAVICVDETMINIKTFSSRPHPFILPNFIDGITWSLPFLADKVTDMLLHVLSICTEEEIDAEASTMIKARQDVIRNKVIAIGKLARYYKILRQSNEEIIELKGLTPTNRLPMFTLHGGSENIKSLLLRRRSFEESKYFDIANERRPDADTKSSDSIDHQTR